MIWSFLLGITFSIFVGFAHWFVCTWREQARRRREWARIRADQDAMLQRLRDECAAIDADTARLVERFREQQTAHDAKRWKDAN